MDANNASVDEVLDAILAESGYFFREWFNSRREAIVLAARS